MTYEEAILKYLAIEDAWVASYDLNKVTLCGTWVGDRGSRSARRLAEEEKIQRELGKDLLRSGIEIDNKNRPIESKYCYYHTKKPLKQVPIYALLPNGERKLVKYEYR